MIQRRWHDQDDGSGQCDGAECHQAGSHCQHQRDGQVAGVAPIVPDSPNPVQRDLEWQKHSGAGHEKQQYRRHLSLAPHPQHHVQIAHHKISAGRKISAQQLHYYLIGALPAQPRCGRW